MNTGQHRVTEGNNADEEEEADWQTVQGYSTTRAQQPARVCRCLESKVAANVDDDMSARASAGMIEGHVTEGDRTKRLEQPLDVVDDDERERRSLKARQGSEVKAVCASGGYGD